MPPLRGFADFFLPPSKWDIEKFDFRKYELAEENVISIKVDIDTCWHNLYGSVLEAFE